MFFPESFCQMLIVKLVKHFLTIYDVHTLLFLT